METPVQLLRILAEETEHAIILLDPDGRILWFNRGAETIFGMTQEGMIGQPSSRLFPPEDIERGIPELEISIAKSGIAAEDDRWMARTDGSRFWATGVLVPLRDEAGTLVGLGKVLRNRTDLKEQIESLRTLAKSTQEESRRKDIFLSTLSHELRNPLAPLVNAVQIIRMSAKDAADFESPLKIIERQVASLRRLVDDLLDVSRIGVGKIELRKSIVPVQEIVHRVVESVDPIVRERHHTLELHLPRAPMLVDADSARLEQVFFNLIHNAAKFTPEGGTIWIKATTEEPDAVVHVQDTGIGIPHEMLTHIFEMFTQVEAARSRSEGGLGIGLSLVQDLVALHGGSVQVCSDGPGTGSEFTVRLPLHGSTLPSTPG